MSFDPLDADVIHLAQEIVVDTTIPRSVLLISGRRDDRFEHTDPVHGSL